MQHRLALVPLVWSLACGSSSPPQHPVIAAPTPVPALSGSAAPIPLACDLRVDPIGFTVDGERFETPQFVFDKAQEAVARLRLKDGSTLVANTSGTHLWWVDCTRTPVVRTLVANPSASTISGELTPDGTTFVFADGAGISALDLATRDVRKIYTTVQHPSGPGTQDCSIRMSTEMAPRDGFDGFDDGGRTLKLYRAGLCHYPDTYRVRIVDWADAARMEVHPANPIYDLAVDLAGTVWVADGGGLRKSADHGDTWQRVKLPSQKGDTPRELTTVQIIPDAKRPKVLLLRTSNWGEIQQGSSGAGFRGFLYRSDNGGATWRELVGQKVEYVQVVVVPNGNVDEFAVPGYAGDPPEWIEPSRPPPAPKTLPIADVGHGATRFPSFDRPDSIDPPVDDPDWILTKNSGKTWTKFAPPALVRKRSIAIGADTLEATDDGLYRTRGGVRTRLTKVLVDPYPSDFF